MPSNIVYPAENPFTGMVVRLLDFDGLTAQNLAVEPRSTPRHTSAGQSARTIQKKTALILISDLQQFSRQPAGHAQEPARVWLKRQRAQAHD